MRSVGLVAGVLWLVLSASACAGDGGADRDAQPVQVDGSSADAALQDAAGPASDASALDGSTFDGSTFDANLADSSPADAAHIPVPTTRSASRAS